MNYLFFIIFISSTMAAPATPAFIPRSAKPGCTDTCGNISIPYPFGIQPNCFLNKWFAVDCKNSKLYLSALENLPLLGVNLNEQMLLVTPGSSSTPNLNVDLSDTPFLFSKSHNKFIVEGCGKAAISSQKKELTGCSTICSPQSEKNSPRNSCNGINCCQTNIPYSLKSYNVSVMSSDSSVSAFMVADNSYVDDLFSGQFVPISNDSISVVLQWTLSENDFGEKSCGYNFSRREIHTGNGSSVFTGKCSCSSESEEGNPYISGGCQVTEECKKCKDTLGVCRYLVSCGGMRTFYCDYQFLASGRKASSSRDVFLGVGISVGVLILIAIVFASYKVIQRAKDSRQKKIFFERNGGLLLKQQQDGNEQLADKTKLFTSNELKKATDYFNENRILGRGGQGTVYKGMLTDGRIVAVKKSKAVDQSQLEQFINEVVVLSQVNHRNVVKLLGCCLETDVPLLVSEFIPNGTLYEHIHGENNDVFFSLNLRLQIATEVAGALSYLHSATSIPIYHRDIKSTNILLDDKYRAKISDFGTSRFVSISQTHLTTLVQGTIGYLDPEYFQSSQFTEKSDVYSFGVVLAELLTGEKPISLTRFGGNRSLSTHFITAFEEGRVMSIFDPKLTTEGARSVLLEVANLAVRCLNLSGKNRPTMKEVATELDVIRMSLMPSMVRSDFGKVEYNAGAEELLTLSYRESASISIV